MCSVTSNSLRHCTVAQQPPLSMGVLQARILESSAMPSFRGSYKGSNPSLLQLLHWQANFSPLSYLGSPFLRQLLLFSCSIMSNSLQPHGLQNSRPPCPSPSPGPCSNSCPLSWWCHSTILSSVVPFSSCLQSFPASGAFLRSWLFTLGGQNIGTSASASVLPMNIQGWFPLDWLVWSSCCTRDSQESSPTPRIKSINSLVFSLLYGPTLTSTHDCWKSQSFDYMDLCQESNVCFLICCLGLW